MYLDSESRFWGETMSDPALDNAMARKAALEQRLSSLTREINDLADHWEKVKGELDGVDQFIRTWHEMAGIQLPDELEQKKAEAPVEGGKRIRPKNPPREDVARRSVNYIREAGRPLMRRELFERLLADGIDIRGKDPEMVLSTMLWRSKDIIQRLPQGGYWPTNEKTPAEVSLEELMGG
jgi:hypothetical protein